MPIRYTRSTSEVVAVSPAVKRPCSNSSPMMKGARANNPVVAGRMSASTRRRPSPKVCLKLTRSLTAWRDKVGNVAMDNAVTTRPSGN